MNCSEGNKRYWERAISDSVAGSSHLTQRHRDHSCPCHERRGAEEESARPSLAEKEQFVKKLLSAPYQCHIASATTIAIIYAIRPIKGLLAVVRRRSNSDGTLVHSNIACSVRLVRVESSRVPARGLTGTLRTGHLKRALLGIMQPPHMIVYPQQHDKPFLCA